MSEIASCDAGFGESPRGGTRRRALIVAGAVLPIAILHAYMVWGIVRGSFYADHGRWLHEIQRFADGQVLYRDYTWPFPPLGVWLTGAPARLLGPGFSVITATTTAVFLTVSLLFSLWVAEVVRDTGAAVGVAVTAFVAALWAAQIGSSPLPAGMYSPAAPLGATFLFGALLAWLRCVRERSTAFAIVAGTCAACAVLTKQDFWIPAATLTGGATIAALLTGRIPRRVAWANIIAALATGVSGLAVVIVTAGWSAVIGMIGGYGQAGLALLRGWPTLSRLTVELLVLAGWCALVPAALAIAARGGGRRRARTLLASAAFAVVAAGLAGLWVLVSMRAARAAGGMPVDSASTLRTALGYQLDNSLSLVRPTIVLLADIVARHLVPVSAAIVVAGLVYRWRPARSEQIDRRFVFLALLAVAFTLRIRRLFEYVEWYHYLVALPLFIGILVETVPMARAAIRRAVLVILLPIAGVAVWQFHVIGAGPLTKNRFEAVRTERGTVRLGPSPATVYREMRRIVNEIDPTGTRPLFAYGKTGGINYFLGRRNPTSSTHGFFFSGHAERVRDEIEHASSPILLDVPVYDVERWPANEIRHWDTRSRPSPYAVEDRPFFDGLLGRCKRVAQVPQDARVPAFIAWDCAGGISRAGTYPARRRPPAEYAGAADEPALPYNVVHRTARRAPVRPDRGGAGKRGTGSR